MKTIFNKKNEKTPLMRSLLVPMLIVAVVQALIFYLVLALSSTVTELNTESEKVLVESASRRAMYIETEMNRRWSEVGSIHDSIQNNYKSISSKYALSVEEFLESDKYSAELISAVSDDLLASMRINTANGSFFVLANSKYITDRNKHAGYRGVFFSDSDPMSVHSDYSDIVMLRGSNDIADKYGLNIDMHWKEKFRYAPENGFMNFFFTPVIAAYDNINAAPDELGYWSKPMYIPGETGYDSSMIITYSEPVIIDNSVLGVVGTYVAVNEIAELIPSAEITEDDSSCYAVLTYTDGSKNAKIEIVPEECTSFSQYIGTEVYMSNADDGQLKKINNVKINGSQAYCAYSEISLYDEDSPYADEKWAVAAISNGKGLYTNLNSVRIRLGFAAVICGIISIVITYLVARHTAKPIKVLVKNVKECDRAGTIDVIDTGISEIHDLSVKLNELSGKRTEYQNELVTERERYFLVLQSINENILEYDCINDIFYIRYFRQNSNDGMLITNQYENFTEMVNSGKICPLSHKQNLLDFMQGISDERGTYFKIYKSQDDDSCMWSFVRSRNVYDSSGKLIRVIASAKDVTKEKEQEIARQELERCDPITKFYIAEYGEMMLSRFIMENGDRSSISAIMRILNMDTLLNHYGHTFCSAVLEEVADVIRKVVPKEFIVYCGGMDEFVIITTFSQRGEARDMFRKLIDDVAAIYDNRFLKIESVVGAYIRIQNEPMASSKYKTRFASEAASRFRNELGDIVFADEVSDRSDFVAEFKKNGPHKFMPFGKTRLEEITDITTFAFNIFEKAQDIKVALEVFLKKAGRMLNMDRILIFDMNRDYSVVRLDMQWNAPDMAYIEDGACITDKAEFAKLEEDFRHAAYRITDTAVFERRCNPDSGKVVSKGSSYSVPIKDGDVITGVIVYECHEKIYGDGMIVCLCELTKIVSAYISKSRTSRESRAKSEFLSKMSHEIRTPMNAIIGMTAIAMREEELSPSTMECLKKIDKSSHYLLDLINDILDMSRIESGKMTVEETYLNLEELITQIDSMLRVQTESKGIWLRAEMNLEHVHLLGDPLKLNQILVNIMGNAVKFTSTGGIHLKVWEAPAEDDGIINVSFSVKDTGIGISEENQGKIFKSFEQADAGTVRKYGGTGLGLAISSNLVHMLGGKLEVRSEIGKGSEFFFTIPMKITEPSMQEDTFSDGNIDWSSKRILIVEDDELNIEIAKTLIEAEGMQTELAENGREAVKQFCEHEENYFDAILMDIRMPVMNGIDAAKEIRNTDRADAVTVPIIAMSANAFDEDMRKSVECGMNGHLTKPIDMNKVMETFRKIWSVKQ